MTSARLRSSLTIAALASVSLVISSSTAHAEQESTSNFQETSSFGTTAGGSVEELNTDFAETAAESVDLQDFSGKMLDEALAVSDYQVNGSEVSFTTTSASPEAADLGAAATDSLMPAEFDSTAQVTMDLKDSTSEILVHSDPGNPEVTTALQLKVIEATPEIVSFDITDRATGQTVSYNSDAAYPSFVPAIPIGIAIGAAAWEALVATAAVVILAGVAYISYAKAIEAIRNQKTYEHFAVTIQTKGLFFGNGLSQRAAIDRGRNGGNTWSKTVAGARSIAAGIKNGRIPVGPEIDKSGSGKYYHYHPENRQPAMHAFYGAPRA